MLGVLGLVVFDAGVGRGNVGVRRCCLWWGVGGGVGDGGGGGAVRVVAVRVVVRVCVCVGGGVACIWRGWWWCC